MNILIVSDTHRKLDNLELAIQQEHPDKIIHLGDGEGDEDIIAAIADCPIEIVSGNCDFYSDLPREVVLSVGSHRALLTHGHYYQANFGVERLVEAAIEKGADLVMYGHTHCPLMEEHHGVRVINPGSISYPRQMNRKPSYIILEIDPKGELRFQLHYIDYD